MGKVLFHGDPHGNFELLRADIDKYQPDAVVLVGDQQLERPLDAELPDTHPPIYWIHGNHDMKKEDQYDYLFGSRHPSLHGVVREVAGIRMAGLGGVFRDDVWYPKDGTQKWESIEQFLQNMGGKNNGWRGGLPRGKRDSIWPDEYQQLAHQKADVLVVHEAPESHEYGHRALGDLARAMGVGLVVHGHLGCRYRDQIQGGIEVLGLGDRETEVIDFPVRES